MMCGSVGGPLPGPGAGSQPAWALPDPILPSADADFLNILVSEGFLTGYAYDGQNITLYATGTYNFAGGAIGAVYAAEVCPILPQVCGAAGAIIIGVPIVAAAVAAVTMAVLPTPKHATTASQTLGAPRAGQGNKALGCDKEWEAAYEICAELLSGPNPPRGITGGYNNIYDCARGLVSEACGGNPISRVGGGAPPGAAPSRGNEVDVQQWWHPAQPGGVTR
jgi:hypothetical protein